MRKKTKTKRKRKRKKVCEAMKKKGNKKMGIYFYKQITSSNQ